MAIIFAVVGWTWLRFCAAPRPGSPRCSSAAGASDVPATLRAASAAISRGSTGGENRGGASGRSMQDQSTTPDSGSGTTGLKSTGNECGGVHIGIEPDRLRSALHRQPWWIERARRLGEPRRSKHESEQRERTRAASRGSPGSVATGTREVAARVAKRAGPSSRGRDSRGLSAVDYHLVGCSCLSEHYLRDETNHYNTPRRPVRVCASSTENAPRLSRPTSR